MPTPLLRFGALALVLVLSGCGDDGSSDERPDPTAESAAEVLRAEVSEVTQLLKLTEDNDPNDLIGRPDGYTAATIVFDSRVSCPADDPGVDCGATIEQWPSKAAAEERAEYIEAVQSGSSILGSEWHTVRGNLLLRVSGELKPSDAEGYEKVFETADLAADVSDASDGEAGAEAAEPPAEPWTLIDSGFGSQHGYAWVVARVRNDDDHAGQTVTVNFNLRDRAGELVASGSQVSHFSWPDQVLPVATQVELPQGGRPTSIEATVLVEDEGTFDDQISDDYGTTPGKVYRPEYGDSFGARFEVENPTDEPLSSPSFQVVCTDRAGRIIGGSGEYPDLIPASGSVLVEVDSLYTDAKPDECTGYLAPWF
jgi:hypothetical protein